jgi:hypothetical protein
VLQAMERAVELHRPYVVVADFLLFAVLAEAERLEIPCVALIHTFVEAFHGLPGRVLPIINEMRVGMGLEALEDGEEVWTRADLALVTALSDLDPGTTHAGERFRWVGPVFEPPTPAAKGGDWWPPEDGRPGILVSFSTMRQDAQHAACRSGCCASTGRGWQGRPANRCSARAIPRRRCRCADRLRACRPAHLPQGLAQLAICRWAALAQTLPPGRGCIAATSWQPEM